MSSKARQSTNPSDREQGVRPSLPVAKEEAVRRRAYEIFRSRAASEIPGDEASDWFQAEREFGQFRDEAPAATEQSNTMGASDDRRRGAPPHTVASQQGRMNASTEAHGRIRAGARVEQNGAD